MDSIDEAMGLLKKKWPGLTVSEYFKFLNLPPDLDYVDFSDQDAK